MLLLVIGLLVAGYVLWTSLGGNEAEAEGRYRTFVDAETQQPFKVAVNDALTVPAENPSTGKKTGYPAEFCVWTKDGKIKAERTPVLLNEYIGKPGPTFCPDCGRLVVSRNPIYPPDNKTAKAPPLKAEYMARGRREE